MLHLTCTKRYGLEHDRAKSIVDKLLLFCISFSDEIRYSGYADQFQPFQQWIGEDLLTKMRQDFRIQFDDESGFYLLTAENCTFSLFWHEDNLTYLEETLLEDLQSS